MFGFAKKSNVKSISYRHSGINHPFKQDPVNKSKQHTKKTGKFKLFFPN
jgi:hypothetical protein